jgi:hypothetical protein
MRVRGSSPVVFGLALALLVAVGCGDEAGDGMDAAGDTASSDGGTSGGDGTGGGGEGCGNGAIEANESCDGAALGDMTCADMEGFIAGTLNCTETCELDTTECLAPGIPCDAGDQDCPEPLGCYFTYPDPERYECRVPGTGQVGEACENNDANGIGPSDCAAGLMCASPGDFNPCPFDFCCAEFCDSADQPTTCPAGQYCEVQFEGTIGLCFPE